MKPQPIGTKFPQKALKQPRNTPIDVLQAAWSYVIRLEMVEF